ncbi:putative polyol transporter [Thalictrum thalictroides]|uniref:Putative polyol transporter n=1 Tax=Thalictrum thalictroides TaxID=46969 RepID=A0A7J6XBE5_THATH|nr:putative polyol transporter [Thalictrum thalictroides]
MKEDDLPTTITTTTSKKENDGGGGGSLLGKGRYKFWALAAILLLAFWSMFTGTVTLKWSAGNLNRISDDLDSHIHDDLDVLEIEEREKVVKHMWDIYTHSRRIRIPRFWQEAFEAAYEELTSDTPGVREAAVSEIAKMSMHSIDLEPPPLQSANTKLMSKSSKEAQEKAISYTGNS